MRIIVSIIFLTWFSFNSVLAQSVNKPKLDSLFDVLQQKNKAMGSLAISKNGTVLYERTIGYSSILKSSKIPSTKDTRYRIGSVTKMFTATMIFQLIDDKKLTLESSLKEYFPNLPNATQITIGQLLCHRSGLHDFTKDPDYRTWNTLPKKQEEILAVIIRSGADFQPNEKAVYSNSNYVVLGYLLERITKASYRKNLEKRITSKIKLSNTYVGDLVNPSANESYSYKFIGDWAKQPDTDMSIPGGAGCIVSTSIDLVKFSEALFSGKLISQSSLDQMKKITDGYGMGLIQIPFGAKKAYAHNGSIDGFASNLAYFPEDSMSIAYCTNGQAYPMNSIMIGALSIYFNKQYTIPSFTTITLGPADLEKYTGRYSSVQIPMKFVMTRDNTILYAQADTQKPFPLEATAKNKFKFDQLSVQMEFTDDGSEFTLKLGPSVFTFTKDK